jgi:DNA-binding NarL/FixJ family response regulator
MIRVAIIEDDPVMRNRLANLVEAEPDMTLIATADHFAHGAALIDAGGYDVLLCDLGLPDGNGEDLVRREAATGRDTDIMVITVFAEQKKVLSVVKAGARGYVLKDFTDSACVAAIRDIRAGGSPISPIIARQLLGQVKAFSPSEPGGDVALSDREIEVLNLLKRGFSYVESGDILGVTGNTIGAHVRNIYRKLQVNSRSEAVFEAVQQGIIQAGE